MTRVLILAELAGTRDVDGNTGVIIPYAQDTRTTHSRVWFVDPAVVLDGVPVETMKALAEAAAAGKTA